MENNYERLMHTAIRLGSAFQQKCDALPKRITLCCNEQGLYLTDIFEVGDIENFLSMPIASEGLSAPVCLIRNQDSSTCAFSLILPLKGINENSDTGHRFISESGRLVISGSAEWMAQNGLSDLWREKKDENGVARFVLAEKSCVIMDKDTLSLGIEYRYPEEEETVCGANATGSSDEENASLWQWLDEHRTGEATDEQLRHMIDILNMSKVPQAALCVALYCAIEEKKILKNYRFSGVPVERYYASLLEILDISCSSKNMRKTYSKVKKELEEGCDSKSKNHKRKAQFLEKIG